MTRSAPVHELNIIMRSLAQRCIQVSLANTWTLEVHLVYVILEFFK